MMIGDRPGQCLVSDGFETKTGRADKAKPIQTGKFAIHTLGHERAFASPLNQVGHLLETRPSGATVGIPPVCVPSNAPH
jgi:hypothetical protein